MPDRRSYDAEAYRRLYKTAAWRAIRHQQLSLQPLCEWCLEREVVTEATEVHHAEAHRGNLDLFYSGPFVSTCKPCHSSRGQREDLGRVTKTFGEDGWPVD